VPLPLLTALPLLSLLTALTAVPASSAAGAAGSAGALDAGSAAEVSVVDVAAWAVVAGLDVVSTNVGRGMPIGLLGAAGAGVTCGATSPVLDRLAERLVSSAASGDCLASPCKGFSD